MTNSQYHFSTAQRWNSAGPSIFSEMTKLAHKFNAINLGQGSPNFPGPQKVLEAICAEMMTCHNQYAPSTGEPKLREQVCNFIQSRIGVSYNPHNEVAITCGASEALFCTLNAYLEPGDRVVLFEPAFDLYAQAIANTGAEIVSVPLFPPRPDVHGNITQGWEVDWDVFAAVQQKGFKCIIINSPHNPTGKIFTKEEILRIGNAALENGAIIVADEVYENLVYGKAHPYVSVASIPEFKNSTVRISSAAKTFGFTGLKIGWATAPKELISGLQLVHQSTTFCVNPALQLGLAQCLADEQWSNTYLLNQREAYQEKREILKAILERNHFMLSPSEGTFFLCGNFEKIQDSMNSIEFAKWFVETKRIATIPLAPFYSRPPQRLPWVRFAFCKENETLRDAENHLQT